MGSVPDCHNNVSRDLFAGAETCLLFAKTQHLGSTGKHEPQGEPGLHLHSSPAVRAQQPKLGRRVANKNTP